MSTVYCFVVHDEKQQRNLNELVNLEAERENIVDGYSQNERSDVHMTFMLMLFCSLIDMNMYGFAEIASQPALLNRNNHRLEYSSAFQFRFDGKQSKAA